MNEKLTDQNEKCSLEKCPDKNATISFNVKPKFIHEIDEEQL